MHSTSPHNDPSATPVTPELAVTIVAEPTTHAILISLVPPREPLGNLNDKGRCKRVPVDICCVIDISGSMESEVSASLVEGGAVERTGLSILDVVKHAVRTIVATMQPDDRIAIVTFADKSEIVAGLTPMTTAGKEEVLEAIEKLCPTTATNIWAGLKTGMKVLNSRASVTASSVSLARFSTLFLLTDGMPNHNPPGGIIPSLKSYLDSHPPRFSIHTFGFGYALESQLLLQIARLGQGAYNFIPDASALGAVFIHAVANLCSMYADGVELYVEYPAGSGAEAPVYELSAPRGQSNVTTLCSWGAKVDVGAVQYGQTREFILTVKDQPELFEPSNSADNALFVTARYRPWTLKAGEELRTCTVTLTRALLASEPSEEDRLKIQHHSQRFAFIHTVNELFKSPPAQKLSKPPVPPPHAPGGPRLEHSRNKSSSLIRTTIREFKAILSSHRSPRTTDSQPDISVPELLPTAVQNFTELLSFLQSPPLSTYPEARSLAEDISGEVLLALSAESLYDRWGQHYLPALARYHLLQQCGSFRDPGLQVYGADSPLFFNSRDALDQAFDSLPLPEPLGVSNWQPPVSMSGAFASRSGPCFDGACQIALENGRKALLKDLRRGMRVETPKGARRVVAVLETMMTRREALLCELPGGLKITPWHPIKVSVNASSNGNWVFPASQTMPKVRTCDAVYSLLLEPDIDPDAHAVYIQGVTCVTLGHGIVTQQGSNAFTADVRTHEFLGDYAAIVQSLAKFWVAGGEEGVFQISGVLKDGESGTICGFVPCQEPASGSFVSMSPLDIVVVG